MAELIEKIGCQMDFYVQKYLLDYLPPDKYIIIGALFVLWILVVIISLRPKAD